MFGTRPTNLQITTSSIMRAQQANCPVRQDAPSRYRIRRVVSRSVLPRERFRPLAQNGPGRMSAMSPLCAQKRTSSEAGCLVQCRPLSAVCRPHHRARPACGLDKVEAGAVPGHGPARLTWPDEQEQRSPVLFPAFLGTPQFY